MEPTKFTKGNWIQLESDHYFDCIEICVLDETNKQTHEIARVGGGFDEPEKSECLANISLITCAPKMYKLLEKIRHGDTAYIGYDMYNDIDNLLSEIRGEE